MREEDARTARAGRHRLPLESLWEPNQRASTAPRPREETQSQRHSSIPAFCSRCLIIEQSARGILEPRGCGHLAYVSESLLTLASRDPVSGVNFFPTVFVDPQSVDLTRDSHPRRGLNLIKSAWAGTVPHHPLKTTMRFNELFWSRKCSQQTSYRNEA